MSSTINPSNCVCIFLQVMSISVGAAVSFFLSPREAVRRFDIRVGWRLTIDAYAGMLARDKKNTIDTPPFCLASRMPESDYGSMGLANLLIYGWLDVYGKCIGKDTIH